MKQEISFTIFLKEMEQNELMGRKYKKVCATLNYIEHFLILDSAITGSISIFFFFFFAWYSYMNRIKIVLK